MSYTQITFFYHCYYNPYLTSFHTLPLTFDSMGFYMTSALFMTVCEMTKDQIKAQSFGLVWSLTIEPLWNKLTLDIQVPVFTYISLFKFLPLLASVDMNAIISCQQWGTSEKR